MLAVRGKHRPIFFLKKGHGHLESLFKIKLLTTFTIIAPLIIGNSPTVTNEFSIIAFKRLYCKVTFSSFLPISAVFEEA